MVRLAYSYTPPTIQERFTIKTFINGIRDLEVKKILRVFRCQTSAGARIRALEVEADFSTTRTCDKVSVADPKNEEDNKIEKLSEKLSEKLLQQIDGLFLRRENDMSHKQSMECYRCSSKKNHTTEISPICKKSQYSGECIRW